MFAQIGLRAPGSPRRLIVTTMTLLALLAGGSSAVHAQTGSTPPAAPPASRKEGVLDRIHINPKLFNFDLGGGVTNYVGDVSTRVHTGWNGEIGVGFNVGKHGGLIVEYMYNRFSVSDPQLQQLKVPSGNGWVHSVTLNPIFRFPIKGKLGAYFIGGIGRYERTVEFNQPTTAIANITDRWWGYTGSSQFLAHQVIGSVTNSAIGGNIGAGLTFKIKHGSLFAEARYHAAGNKVRATQMIPLTAGIRF